MILWRTWKKKSWPKSAKVADLGYFETDCEKTVFEKNDFEIYEPNFWDMHGTIPKRCVLGVFWTAQYVFDIYFTWRRLLLTLLTSFYRYNAFRCIYILFALRNRKKNFRFFFWDLFLNGISLDFCKNPRNIHFDLNSTFSLSYKISFADVRSLFMKCVPY